MAVPDIRSVKTVVLVDTMIAIEAVRTGIWKALTGARLVETVEECRSELQRGDRSHPNYLEVAQEDLDGLSIVHPVTEVERATLLLTSEGASNLDAGERDLLAHALACPERGDGVWVVLSSDIACVKVAVALGLADHMASLEEIADAVGARPRPPLRRHFTRRWLSSERTKALLE